MTDFQRTFLHTPVRDSALLHRYVKDQESETEQLDFKGELALKDLAVRIAAFANHLGGDIIIGIEEKDDHAECWKSIPKAQLPVEMQRITQALERIHPSDFRNLVAVNKISAEKPDYYAIVVSVPPSPEIVCVEADHKLSFPIRVETHTQYLGYEAVMIRTSVATRAAYLKLSNLVSREQKQTPIRFSGPVATLRENNRYPVAVRSDHAFFASISPEVITVDMMQLEFRRMPGGRMAPSSMVEFYLMGDTRDKALAIPLELVRAAWHLPVPNETTRVCLALDAEILWNGQSWCLVTRL